MKLATRGRILAGIACVRVKSGLFLKVKIPKNLKNEKIVHKRHGLALFSCWFFDWVISCDHFDTLNVRKAIELTIQSPFFTVDVCTGRVWGGQLLLYYDIGAVDFAQNHVFCIANPFFCPYFHEICYFNSFYQYFGWVMGVFAQQGPKTSLFKENYAHYWIFYYLKLHPPWLLAWTTPPPELFFSAQIAYLGVF